MTEIINKITSYNLFNYLLPGVLFAAILDKFTIYSLIPKDIIIGAFVYYFIGLVISRFGSLLVEPILKKISFLKFADYADFISASQKDPKIELLSEENNMYRNFNAMFIILVLMKFYEWIQFIFPVLKNLNIYILIILLLVIFLCSYKKQTEYITKRVNKANR